MSEQKISHSERLNTSRDRRTLCIKIVGMSNIRLSRDEQVPVKTYTSPGTRWSTSFSGSFWVNKCVRGKIVCLNTLSLNLSLKQFLRKCQTFYSRIYFSFSDIILKRFLFYRGKYLLSPPFFSKYVMNFTSKNKTSG